MQYPTQPSQTHTTLSTVKCTPYWDIFSTATSLPLPFSPIAKHKLDFQGPPHASALNLLQISHGARAPGGEGLGEGGPSHNTKRPRSLSSGTPSCKPRQPMGPSSTITLDLVHIAYGAQGPDSECLGTRPAHNTQQPLSPSLRTTSFML